MFHEPGSFTRTEACVRDGSATDTVSLSPILRADTVHGPDAVYPPPDAAAKKLAMTRLSLPDSTICTSAELARTFTSGFPDWENVVEWSAAGRIM